MLGGPLVCRRVRNRVFFGGFLRKKTIGERTINAKGRSCLLEGCRPVDKSDRAMKSQTVRSDVRVVEIAPKPPEPPVLLGNSLVIDQLRRDIESAGRSDAKVLILGETGVGKEVVARLVHHGGARWDRPFLAINCAGTPRFVARIGAVRACARQLYRCLP